MAWSLACRFAYQFTGRLFAVGMAVLAVPFLLIFLSFFTVLAFSIYVAKLIRCEGQWVDGWWVEVKRE